MKRIKNKREQTWSAGWRTQEEMNMNSRDAKKKLSSAAAELYRVVKRI